METNLYFLKIFNKFETFTYPKSKISHVQFHRNIEQSRIHARLRRKTSSDLSAEYQILLRCILGKKKSNCFFWSINKIRLAWIHQKKLFHIQVIVLVKNQPYHANRRFRTSGIHKLPETLETKLSDCEILSSFS